MIFPRKIMSRKFIEDYFEEYKKIFLYKNIPNQLLELKELLLKTKENKSKVIIAGNGGSSSIASHLSIDLTKQAKIRTINFNESNLITCFSNDFGYENWLSKSLEYYADQNDVIILISSSGKSQNIINAARFSLQKNLKLITFTGFDEQNPLKNLGAINFWVNRKSYNIVENAHQIWLTILCDMIIGKREYLA